MYDVRRKFDGMPGGPAISEARCKPSKRISMTRP
jgi:hypothetical protein